MPEYLCKLGTTSGEVIERTFNADNQSALREDLEQRDYLVFRIRRRNPLLSILWPFGSRRRKVPAKEFLAFNQELEALIRAGLPVMTCFDVLIERRKNATFRKSLLEIREEIRSGSSLSAAFEAQGDLYPRLYCSSVASGERSGELATVLRRYVDYTKTMVGMRNKVSSALVYPGVILILAGCLVAIMFFWVLPSFNEFYEDFDAELPLLTKFLLGVSAFLQKRGLWVGAAAIGAVVGINYLRTTRAGRMGMDRWKLRMPFLGKVFHNYAVSRFTRTLATLVSGGIPLVASIEVAAEAVGNHVFLDQLERVARKVREGQSLWLSLEETGLFPDIVVEMVKVGESTGSLEEMLNNVSVFFEEEIEQSLGTIVTLLEPIMLVTMGFVVVGMLMAMYLPLIRAYSATSY